MQPPNKPFLIVVGGSVRSIAQWARHAGFTTFAIDRFGDEDTRAAATWLPAPENWDDLPNLLENLPPAALVWTGGLEPHGKLIEEISSRREILAATDGVLRKLADFERANDWMQFAGGNELNFPEQVSSSVMPPGRWLWKRYQSFGGLGVIPSRQTKPVDPQILLEAGYWQREIAGRAFGLSFLGGGDCQPTIFLGACGMLRTPYRIRARSLIYAGSFGPVEFSAAALASLIQFATRLSRAVNLRGWFGIDLIRDREGRWWFLELNPRWCSSMELLARSLDNGVEMLNQHFNAVRGMTLSLDAATYPDRSMVRIKKIVYADRDIVISEKQKGDTNLILTGTLLCDLPIPGTKIKSGEPIFSMIVEGKTLLDAAKKLRREFPDALSTRPQLSYRFVN